MMQVRCEVDAPASLGAGPFGERQARIVVLDVWRLASGLSG
jgi:hypothetical protein